MSWIQENKFTATLAGVTAVGSAVLLYLAIQQSGDEKAVDVRTSKLAKEEASLKAEKPYPSVDNLEAKKQNVADFAASANQLQAMMVKYRPESMDDFQPADFGPLLSTYRTSLNALFEGAGTVLPERTFYGFEDYANRLPKNSATGELRYQLEACQWLFTKLAEAKPEKLLNVYRAPLEAESGVVKKDEAKGKGSKGAPVQVYQSELIELSFLVAEKNLTGFLQQIANSEQYFFTVRSIRLRNEVQASPSKNSAKFETRAPANDDLFGIDPEGDTGGFLQDPSDEADAIIPSDGAVDAGQPAAAPAPIDAPKAVGAGEKILKQILGKEKVYVTMQLELILFEPKDEVVIPGTVSSGLGNVNEDKEGK